MRNRRNLFILATLLTLLLGSKLANTFSLMPTAGAAPIVFKADDAGLASASERQFEQIRELLILTESGRTALALMAQYEVGLKFDHNRGTIYHVPSNTMIIDAGQSPTWAAINFVHEMHHAHYLHQGLRADIHGLDREEYVRQKIEEEALGIVISIEAKTELWKAGIGVMEFNYPLEEAYREAYLKAVEDAVTQEAGQETGDLMIIGREAGTARVYEGLMAGEVWRSSSEISYPDYFAKDWEKANLFGPLSRLVADLLESAG